MAKTKTSKLFERWYNKSGARLFDKIGRKRSKLWMREVYNSIRGEKNPKTGKKYTHRETINKIKNRREFLDAEQLGSQNLMEQLFSADSTAKRRFKGGHRFNFMNTTFVRAKNGSIYMLYMDGTAGSPTPNYMEYTQEQVQDLYKLIAGSRESALKWIFDNGEYLQW